MAPSFLNLKEIRRRSRNSFRTERSTDGSSEASNGTAPTTGSLTPPSFSSHQSDPALNVQVNNQQSTFPTPPATAPSRPAPHPYPAGNPNRYSVSGMTGLGSPMPNGRGPNLPVSQYSPRITSIQDNSWVSWTWLCLANDSPLAMTDQPVTGLSKGPPCLRHRWGAFSAIH